MLKNRVVMPLDRVVMSVVLRFWRTPLGLGAVMRRLIFAQPPQKTTAMDVVTGQCDNGGVNDWRIER